MTDSISKFFLMTKYNLIFYMRFFYIFIYGKSCRVGLCWTFLLLVFLAATIIPFSSELVLSILIAKNSTYPPLYLLHQLEIGLVGLVVI